MTRLKGAAVLVDLIDRLRAAGSWTGETHVQKAMFLLKEGAHEDVPFDFILYKYGPFSFELRDELNELRADGLIDQQAQPYPYGPSVRSSEQGSDLKKRYPNTLKRVKPALEWVVDAVGTKGVGQLERISTALYILRVDGISDPATMAARLVDLKPHVRPEQASAATEELFRLLAVAPRAA